MDTKRERVPSEYIWTEDDTKLEEEHYEEFLEYVRELSHDPDILMPRDAAYVRQLIRESIKRSRELPDKSHAVEIPFEEAIYRWLWDMYDISWDKGLRMLDKKSPNYGEQYDKLLSRLLEEMKEKRQMQENL